MFFTNTGVKVGYLICGKCKSYYELQSGDSVKDFARECDCGGKLRYVENLDIVDPNWRPIFLKKKPTKGEVLRDKSQSVSRIPLEIKNRLTQFFNKNFGNLIYNIKNRNRVYRTPHDTPHGSPYGMGNDFIGSILNELNFHNIRWTVVIPVAIVIAVILAFVPGILTLLTFVLLVTVGYLFDDRIIGTKNAVVTGAISYFLGYLITGSFLLLIPLTILGVINGVVCGWIGGYLRIKTRRG